MISSSSSKLVISKSPGLPSILLIDKEEIIQYYTVNNLPCERNVNKLLRILQSVQFDGKKI